MNSNPFLIKSDGSVPVLSSDKGNPFKVGDILHSAAGYEASISEFHKVVKVSGKNVWIVKLPVNRKYTGLGGMEWESYPDLNSGHTGPEMRRLVKNGDHVKINSYRTAWKWDGKVSHDYNYH